MAAGYGPSLTEQEAAAGGRPWLVVVAMLAAGWGALFAYSAVFLAEDAPLRPPTREASRSEAAGPDDPLTAGPVVLVRPVALTAPSRPPVPAETAPTAPIAPPPPRAEYVGTWGPNPAACGSPSRRRGFIPATITAERAQAGRTVCTFRDGRRAGNAWTMDATCSERGRRWSSQVRLVVEGDRLTWSSGRGTSAYVRCRSAG